MEKEAKGLGLITTIDTELNIVESDALKRAVASDMLIPDPADLKDEQSSLDKEEDNG